MTFGTSASHDGGTLDVTLGTVQRLHEMAFANYEQALKDNHGHAAAYWDGYGRAIEELVHYHHN